MTGLNIPVASKSMSQQASGPNGYLLEDRIRDGRIGCVAEQTAIALQIARALDALHRSGKYHGRIGSGSLYLDDHNRVTVRGELSSDAALEGADICGFGLVLYELLSGSVEENRGSAPDLEPLYQAGITPRLVEMVTGCVRNEREIANCVKELEAILREMPGAPASRETVNRTLLLAVIAVCAVAGVLWLVIMR